MNVQISLLRIIDTVIFSILFIGPVYADGPLTFSFVFSGQVRAEPFVQKVNVSKRVLVNVDTFIHGAGSAQCFGAGFKFVAAKFTPISAPIGSNFQVTVDCTVITE